ncbi:hypothetical protein [Hoeflea sp.]
MILTFLVVWVVWAVWVEECRAAASPPGSAWSRKCLAIAGPVLDRAPRRL